MDDPVMQHGGIGLGSATAVTLGLAAFLVLTIVAGVRAHADRLSGATAHVDAVRVAQSRRSAAIDRLVSARVAQRKLEEREAAKRRVAAPALRLDDLDLRRRLRARLDVYAPSPP